MRALKILNGDLVLGSQGYAEVTGLEKVSQDLIIAVKTPYKSNSFHPGWGSTLEDKIGTPQNTMTASLVAAEVKRVISVYMALQSSQLTAAKTKGYTPQYTNEEIVTGIESLTTSSSGTSVNVQCNVITAAGGATLNASVSPAGVSGSFRA